jgi:hypothetical protein
MPNLTPKSLQSVAGEWHGGQGTALYAYASTGAVVAGLEQEIVECFTHAQPRELCDLQRLYVAVAPTPTKWTVGHNQEFWHRLARNADGTPVRCRRNGKMRVWKTRPDDFLQPVKYGLKECFYLTPEVIHLWVVAP